MTTDEEEAKFVPYEFGGLNKANTVKVIVLVVGIIVGLLIVAGLGAFVIIELQRASQHGSLEVTAHRGARGLLPENSVLGFTKSAELGMKTLHMDVVISGDGLVVVSADPYLDHEICTGPNGETIPSHEIAKLRYNLYNMTYETQIRPCDCGSLGNPLFPSQEKVKTSKPLLSEAIDTVERHVQTKSLSSVYYNVEIRSTPQTDNVFHPTPDKYARAVYNVLRGKKVLQKTVIQSEDPRALKEMRVIDSSLTFSLVVRTPTANETRLIQDKLNEVGFTPKYIVLDIIDLNDEVLQFATGNKLQVFAIPVNSEKDVLHLRDNKLVTGIFTDFPDVIAKMKSEGQL
jgi:glycerophosphoryl diester phosphodiesterase